MSRSLYLSIASVALGGMTVASLPELRAQAPQDPSAQSSQQGPATPAPQALPAVTDSHPIAIVPLNTATAGHAAVVSGDLQIADGRAVIAANASIASNNETTRVTLPYRGMLLVCANTTVKLTADTSAPAGEVPGLLMALEHGAVEMSFAAGRANTKNADTLLTPDFRILINGAGAADVKVRLGPKGDTCIDNPGADAPYVLVSSVFEGGAYRVQPGQHVMFQHGSLHEVVDEEKEPCGCPPAESKGNEFPLAQSEGLAPLPKPKAVPETLGTAQSVPVAPLVYNAPKPVATETPKVEADKATASLPATDKKKVGFFGRVGHFFKRLFEAQ